MPAAYQALCRPWAHRTDEAPAFLQLRELVMGYLSKGQLQRCLLHEGFRDPPHLMPLLNFCQGLYPLIAFSVPVVPEWWWCGAIVERTAWCVACMEDVDLFISLQ